MNLVSLITQAHKHQKESGFKFRTQLHKSSKLSDQFQAEVYLKREDQLLIRVFKMRGAYNSFINLTKEEKEAGLVTVSDGNFAQAFAYFCNHFQIKGTVFLPEVCFSWKQQLIRKYGKEFVEIKTVGESFEEAQSAADQFVKEGGKKIIHPCDNIQNIIGNGTIAVETIEDFPGEIDYLFIPVGAGALAAGIATYFKKMSPKTKIIGVQPEGADSMMKSLEARKPVRLQTMSRFCDGSAVFTVPQITLDFCLQALDQCVKVPEGRLSSVVLQLYNQGIAVEPAGALGVAALDEFQNEIKGKNVVCIVSGGTVDLSRFDEFKEYSLLYEGLKYFILIQLPLRPGILKEIVTNCLGPDDELCHMQFQKKQNRERGPCLMVLEVKKKENINDVIAKMKNMKLEFQIINERKDLCDLLI